MRRRWVISVVLIVLDSVGIGDSPDATEYGTEGSNTLSHVSEYAEGLNVPVMEHLGLGKIYPLLDVNVPDEIEGCFGALYERSNAVDSTTGHWEMMGVEVEEPFPTYPDGFPDEVIEPFEEVIGRSVLGNRAASGTKIIEDLGEEHLESGNPIVYTSADSVFQVAAHEDVIPVDELYEICREAREILTGEHAVGRVIARPFIGELGDFDRTHRRKDFTISPTGRTVLEDLQDNGISVYSVGKINQIFSGEGIDEAFKTKDNQGSIERTLTLIEETGEGSFIFSNLVDFDMRYGHRNDPAGYARALEDWDEGLGKILDSMDPDDLLMITADHGTDPTTDSTDHSRELVPLLVAGEGTRNDVDLGVRIGFGDLGQTILDYFDLPRRLDASSFLGEIR